jgi:hypothetical protein
MKLSSFDLVPGVDFLHVDHFEWATFVLKYFQDFATPEMAKALCNPPAQIDQELLSYWDGHMTDKKGVISHYLPVRCLRCPQEPGPQRHTITRRNIKLHILVKHEKVAMKDLKVARKRLFVREGVDWEWF